MITTQSGKKLLLTKSMDGDVIIAEVERGHALEQGKEFFISKDTLKANLLNKTFKDISDQVAWNGKVYIHNPNN